MIFFHFYNKNKYLYVDNTLYNNTFYTKLIQIYNNVMKDLKIIVYKLCKYILTFSSQEVWMFFNMTKFEFIK